MQTQSQTKQFAMTHHRRRNDFAKALTFFFAATLINFVAKGEEDFCKTTTRTAYLACRSGAQSDLQIALGKAANLSDPVARKAAREQAMADYKEVLEDCMDQREAREAVCERLGGAPYDPVINPSNFVSNITNPFYPLVPGTTFYYLGGSESNVVSVTHNTRVILGVTCIEVHDVVYIDGELEEDTLDWFAQDTSGNVWYMGENSQEIAGGLVVSLEGSWIAGVDGAEPGIIMKAAPAIGDFYRQEFLLNDAEDLAEVQSLTESVTVPNGSYSNCLKTEETSPLEPEALEHKFYASGIGNVLVIDEATGERAELVKVTTGN
jgi:hypothetical protein